MKKYSDKEAYAAMYAFLEHQYQSAGSNELGSLLGSMSLLPSGSTADPAVWGDWQNALNKASSGDVRIQMELK